MHFTSKKINKSNVSQPPTVALSSRNGTLSSASTLPLSSLSLASSKRAGVFCAKKFSGANVRLCWLLMLLLIFLAHQQICECRYLPTRSHGDDLDKLRELMLQILESSNEDAQSRSVEPNRNSMLHRDNWLNAVNSLNNVDAVSRIYNGPVRPFYNNGRYY